MKLEAIDISFKYGKGSRQILDHVNLSVEPGEKVGIMAPSGYGKTTLCKILAGYERPDQGKVLVDGMPILKIRGYCPVQMVWQHPELSVNPKRRLSTVLAEGDWTFEDPGERARIEEGLGIRDEWKERFPVEVSGGELQRFCIARALGRKTKLLIADEMTTMLDLITQGQIWEFVLKELKRREMGMIAVSHSPELLEKVKEKGVNIAHVTLHVGLGTFRPVKVDTIEDHHMHSEFYIVEESEAKKINDTKANGGRVICVGTTSCRTLESATGDDGILKAGSGWTEIFIYPGYKFKILDCLITNFHLPESTLVMLVSALAGREHILNAYNEAIKERYRFFSFGDAMFIHD